MTILAERLVEDREEQIEREEMEVAYKFRAMNTNIEIIIYTDQPERETDACYTIENLFTQAEASLSRFRPASELSRLNREGYIEDASELLFENVRAARQMAELTEGIFDPTILDALQAAGYDRSFELIAGLANRPHLFNPPRLLLRANWQQIGLNPARCGIYLPFGMHLDLGGIAKGSTVDRAASVLRQAGFSNFMVSAGGDMFVQGRNPHHERGWTVGIENPLDLDSQEFLTTINVRDKAVATSSTAGRRWTLNGRLHHHLIDPRTNQPADTGIMAVTAVANSVQMADVMAKTALILGPAEIQKKLQKMSEPISLILVTSEGAIVKL